MVFLFHRVMKPPKAKKKATLLQNFDDTRTDFYYWMRERENPEVIRYLEKENLYTTYKLKKTEKLQQQLFEEMKARYKKDDESIPYYFNNYWYLIKENGNQEYPLIYRKHLTLEASEELLLDINVLAENEKYLETGSFATSPNNHIFAFSLDNKGRRIFTLYFKDLKNGNLLPDQLINTTGKAVWSNDNRFVFYVKNAKNLRAYKVFRHQMGTHQSQDIEVFHEKNSAFEVSIEKTKSQKYIFINSGSTLSEETRFLDADNISSEWKIIQKRKPGLEYSVDEYNGEFYIITNAGNSTNFKLVKTPIDSPEIQYWQEIIPHRREVLLEGFEVFKNFLVLEERINGLQHLRIINNTTGESHKISFSEPAYTAYLGLNLNFDTDEVQYGYSSLTTPTTTWLYNMKTRTQKLLKKQEIPEKNYIQENYFSERIWIPSRDKKTKIPVSIVYHKNTPKTPNTPLLLYGYGSYGISIDPEFSSVRLSLLDRGFIYAIAHIRGGEDLGRPWYEEGKLLKKKNTFYDFIDVAKFLIQQNYTSSKHLYAMGGSAGGLLMGAVMNMESQLFNGIIAQVPFVDVVTTMLDEDIPLTTGEYDEWGNPHEKVYYDYLKSYSPYDNISAKEYPNLLVTTGFQDSQVQYWEAAKWVAQLRATKTDSRLLLLKTDMTSGHDGTSGRFESLKEDALETAFLLMLEQE